MKVPQPTERSGPLTGHVRKGRIYRPPLMATGVVQIGDWVRDDLPDMLWPILALSELGTEGAVRFVRWQEAVQRDLSGAADAQLVAECLDGTLTGLDRLTALIPDASGAVKIRAEEAGLLPRSVAAVLATYPRRPAEWLVDREVSEPTQEQIDLLARAVLHVIQDGHREAVIKCLHIWSAVQAGTLRTNAETIELLRVYPQNLATRAQTDSTVRAMWGARRALRLHEDGAAYFANSVEWARVFWGVNSITSGCMRLREHHANDVDLQEDDASGALDDAVSSDDANGASPEPEVNLQRFASDLLASYVEALETSPSRLYDHEMQEVHSGLVARVGRDVITALGAPDLWCMEHGAHIIRALVEARIYLQWMAQQPISIYRAFQEYGAGKAKLYAQIVEELPAEARRPGFEEAIGDLRRLSHTDDVLDHRVVDTRDSFADGKSIRAMAEEGGLIDLYRQAYSLASGVSHSEWWSIETHAMERCLNILHGGHLIPSLSLNSGGNVDLARSWIDQLYTLIRISLNILSTDRNSVDRAFSWLDDEAEGENQEHDSTHEV